jgi:ornithine decarboxylase
MGLQPKGISFHVGSQQRDINKWNLALVEVADIFKRAGEAGINLDLINMGGGFPADYVHQAPRLTEYAESIRAYLKLHFSQHAQPKIILEPGRSLVGNAGVLVTEIITVAKKNNADKFRWVYVDAGKFNGLIETMEEGIKYPVLLDGEMGHSRTGEVILAGPTCDSVDIMYEKNKYRLPMNAKSGQRLYWLSAGAYTASYASVEFNGFPPIKSYFIQ